ncbi:MAG: phosphomethylpyrimidine synthase [Nitrospira bacterium HGW-Nitrospira-1]|nr:MAG: phosphomethylpyrimidine synthase [Nitrospira bacterium HGW-Nitrospira-1]
MTRIETAKKGIVTDEVRLVAAAEGISPEQLSEDIAAGVSVIPINKNHRITPLGIGKMMRTKINANIGTSKDKISIESEMEKLEVLVKYGADAVMDLSTGGPIKELRNMMLRKSPIAVGTVPIYEAAVWAAAQKGSISKMTPDDLFEVIEAHAAEGVDFVTVHSGLTMRAVERLKSEGRILDIVSRGGSFLLEWMIYNEKDNPLYEQYDRLLEIALKYDMTLSLGDGMRPGCLADATDRTQIEELLTLGELRDRAIEANVQVIIEGPGHVPLNQVELNVRLEKEICKGAPFYVLGPLVTDIGMGYDHVSAAIGGAVAGAAGADFLCYVTPSEHIRLPSIDDVKEGVIDMKMAKYRKALDWNGQISLSLNPDKVREWRAEIPPTESEVCSMCGEFCAIRTVERALKKGV